MTTAGVVLDHARGSTSPSSASSNNVRIWLNGDVLGVFSGWNNSSPGPTITVVSGETVSLFLNATDTLGHDWFIDTLKMMVPDPNGISSPDFRMNNSPLSFTFTPLIGQNVPTAGNWTYRCKYHPTAMYGTIRVVEPDFSLSASPSSIITTMGTSATSIITVSPLFSFTGTVTLSVMGTNGIQTTISPVSIPAASGSATLTVVTPSADNYTATVIGTDGSQTQSLIVTVQAGDFAISADPTITAAQINSPATSTVTVTPLNHFAGAISLTSNSTACTLYPASLTGSGVSGLSCIFGSSGSFHVQVSGSIASLSHSSMVIFDVEVPDFTVTANPTSLTIVAGQTGNSTISLLPINGFTGVLNLSESQPSGLSCVLSPASVALGTSGTSKLSCEGDAGNYTIVVEGTNGSMSRSSTTFYSVQDFGLTASPTIINLIDNKAGVSNIRISATNRFANPITMTTNSSYCHVSPAMLTPPLNTTLSCNFPFDGTFHVELTSASGPLSHSMTITYNVTSTIHAASGLGPLGWIQVTEIIVTIALAGSLIYLFARRRASSRPEAGRNLSLC